MSRIDYGKIDSLLAELEDKNNANKIAARDELYKYGRPVVPYLIDQFGKLSLSASQWVVNVLVYIGGEQATAFLTHLLQETRYPRKEYICSCLGASRNPQYVNALVFQLERSLSDDTKVTAASVLGEIKDPRAIVPLIEAAHWPGDPQVRSTAIDSLAKIGGDRAVPAMIRALKDIDSEVRIAAAKALLHKPDLERFPEASYKLAVAIQDNISSLSSSDANRCSHAARALSLIGAQCALEPLLENLDRVPERAKISFISALGSLGDDKAVASIAKYLNDNKIEIRYSTVNSLHRIRGHESYLALREALDEWNDHAPEGLESLYDESLPFPLKITFETVRKEAERAIRRMEKDARDPGTPGA